MELIPQFGAITLTLALLAALLWWLRRRGLAQWNRSRPGRLMEVIESRTLSPGHTLHLVRVALATHGGGCTLLEARPWSEIRQGVPPEVRL